jgi:hypothetical protein
MLRVLGFGETFWNGLETDVDVAGRIILKQVCTE